jgi:hypothetical protein
LQLPAVGSGRIWQKWVPINKMLDLVALLTPLSEIFRYLFKTLFVGLSPSFELYLFLLLHQCHNIEQREPLPQCPEAVNLVA